MIRPAPIVEGAGIVVGSSSMTLHNSADRRVEVTSRRKGQRHAIKAEVQFGSDGKGGVLQSRMAQLKFSSGS